MTEPISPEQIRPCRHEESLYGRCTACGMTWEQQAKARVAPCASCGEPSIHTITLRGEPVRVCLRHLNVWREPVEQHAYGVNSDCVCGRNFATVRGLREHLTKQRKGPIRDAADTPEAQQ